MLLRASSKLVLVWRATLIYSLKLGFGEQVESGWDKFPWTISSVRPSDLVFLIVANIFLKC